MSLGTLRSHRKLAAALALAGVAFYAALLPWHLTSQLSAQLFRAQFGDFGLVICKGGTATSTAQTEIDPLAPKAPGMSCPICKGLAAFQLAVVTAALAGLLEVKAGPDIVEPAEQAIADAVVPTPRSRGPPSLPA
jgi:hypothetical protein